MFTNLVIDEVTDELITCLPSSPLSYLSPSFIRLFNFLFFLSFYLPSFCHTFVLHSFSFIELFILPFFIFHASFLAFSFIHSFIQFSIYSVLSIFLSPSFINLFNFPFIHSFCLPSLLLAFLLHSFIYSVLHLFHSSCPPVYRSAFLNSSMPTYLPSYIHIYLSFYLFFLFPFPFSPLFTPHLPVLQYFLNIHLFPSSHLFIHLTSALPLFFPFFYLISL